MAKIEISVDTEKRTVEAKVDGKKVQNLGDIVIYSEEGAGFFGVDITQFEKLDDSTRKMTRISANRYSPEYVEPTLARAKENARPSSHFPGMYEFVVPDFTSAELSVALFGRDRT